MRPRVCHYCNTPMPREVHLYHCVRCGMPNTSTMQMVDVGKIIRPLEDSGEPELEVHRYDIGIYNAIFGGGLAYSSVNMVAGPPGAGKTTLFLIIADMVLDQTPAERRVLYIANEMKRNELYSVFGKRLGLRHMNRIDIWDAYGGLGLDLRETIAVRKPLLVILDSLTKLTGEDPQLGLLVTTLFKDLSAEFSFPTLIVNQVTKDGEHAGSNKVLHAGDSVLHFELDEVTKLRHFYSSKNRFGEAPIEMVLRMLPSDDPQRPGFLVLAEEARKGVAMTEEEEEEEEQKEGDLEEEEEFEPYTCIHCGRDVMSEEENCVLEGGGTLPHERPIE